MDGWWNEDGYSQEPWEASRQENPFARNSAAAPDEHDAQPEPEPKPEPALRPGELYGQEEGGAQQHSFSQIRQGDLYGYAAPEAAPAPAFPGQDPFGESAGVLPFGAFDPDPLTGEPPLTGGVPFFGDGGFAPGGDTAAFAAMPFQTSYAGFPPLTGNTTGNMPPVDPNLPWQNGNTTGNMPPIDPNLPWQNGNTTGNMPPIDPNIPWQTGNTTGNIPPIDPNLPWQTGNTTGNMPPIDPNLPWQTGNTTGNMPPIDPNMPWQTGNTTGNMPTIRWDRNADPAQWQVTDDPAAMGAETRRWQPEAQPWQAPAGTTAEDWILPEYPEADPNWQPPEGEAPVTPDFLKEIIEPPKPEDPNDRLNIPVYLRKPKLERKRPTGKPIRKPEAADAAADAKAAAETIAAGNAVAAAENVVVMTDAAANREAATAVTAEAGTDNDRIAEAGEQAGAAAETAAATDAAADTDAAAAVTVEAGTDDDRIAEAGEQAGAAADAAAAMAEADKTIPMTDPSAEAAEPQPGRAHRTRRSHSAESEAAETTPEGDIYYTDAVYMRPSSLKPLQPVRAKEASQAEAAQGDMPGAEAPVRAAETQPQGEEPGAEAPGRAAENLPQGDMPGAEAPVRAAETQPEKTRTEETPPQSAVHQPDGSRPEEPAAAEPKPRRSRLQERQNAVLQPAPSLPRKRRSQPQPESTAEGNSAPFVKAAAAEDTGADAPSARPLTEAVSLLPGAAVQLSGNPADPNGGWPALNDPNFADDDSYRFRQLFGQQPLYGDLLDHTGPQPLPGPAADDPNVPYADELLPLAPATDEAIEAAVMQDAALETALSGGLRPLAPGELYGAEPTPPEPEEAAVAEAPMNPYAAAFGAAAPQPSAPSGLLLEDDWPGEDDVWTEEDFAPLPPENSRPEPLPAKDPAPAADAALTAGSALLAGIDPAAAPEPSSGDPLPLPDPAGDPLPPESLAELLPETPAEPLFPIDPQPFPELSALDKADPQPAPEEPAAPLFGTSSYDAGAMPNPSRGNLPYEVVSAFDTDSRRRAELLAAQYAQRQPEPPPEELQPRMPLPVKQPKPPRAPIKPMRVVVLALIVLMLVFCLLMGGRMLLGYVQNTEDWADFYRNFSAENGINVNQAGEMVQLRSDGSTFPPSGGSTVGPLVTPLPQTVVSSDAQSSVQSAAGQGRTRQNTYYGNELRNILEPMATPHRDYPDVKGRLIIPGVVDEWLVQRNNTYYLNHNYRGSAEEGGAVFIDTACTLDTPPENLHLRASDSAQGQTFQPLWQYKTEGAAFALEASHAFVTTLYEQIDYQLVAVFEASLEPGHPMYFNYASSPTFATDAEMMNYIVQVRQRSLYALPAQVQPGDRLLTLSTVSGADAADERSTSLVLIFAGRPKTQ